MTWTDNEQPFGVNHAPLLSGLASDGSGEEVPVAVDKDTGELLVSSGGGGGGTSSTFGAVFPATGTAVGATDGTNMQPLKVDGSGNLKTVDTNSATIATNTGNSSTSANQTNGTQQTKLTNGTNIADVVAGDTGFNGVATASATKTYTFTTSASGAQTILANTPTEGFSWIEIVYTSVGSGLALTGQYSTTSGGTYVNSASFGSGASSASMAALGVTNNAIFAGPIRGNFFQIAVSALTSGTFAGTVTLRAMAPPIATMSSAQAGTWTVGSNSATASAVPANAFYMGLSDQSAKLTGAVSANTAAATTGNGLLGVGVLGYDGSNYQRAGIDANKNISVSNASALGTPVSATVYPGQATVTNTATALASSQVLTQGVTIEALSTNAVSVYVGKSGTTTSTGLELPPGASITLPVSNLNVPFVVCSTGSPVVTYIGI